MVQWHIYQRKKEESLRGCAKRPINIFNIWNDFFNDVNIWTWTCTSTCTCGCTVDSAWVQYMLLFFFVINWASECIQHSIGSWPPGLVGWVVPHLRVSMKRCHSSLINVGIHVSGSFNYLTFMCQAWSRLIIRADGARRLAGLWNAIGCQFEALSHLSES